jgi:hypothetical protein
VILLSRKRSQMGAQCQELTLGICELLEHSVESPQGTVSRTIPSSVSRSSTVPEWYVQGRVLRLVSCYPRHGYGYFV